MAAATVCRVGAKTAAAPAKSTGATTALRHLRIVSSATTHEYPAYANVERLQARLQRELLSWKTAVAAAAEEDTTTISSSPKRSPPPPPPPPTLISFTPQPTYTLGRRQTAPLDAAERAWLTAPLTMPSSPSPSLPTPETKTFTPAVTGAPRGGLATYHGPGQVVLWPVIDLRSPLHRGFSVRDYACLLEKTTIAALAKFGAEQPGGGLRGFTTENPGVWVRRRQHHHHYGGGGGGGDVQGDERKISALGVHLRRHVTGLGVAVNFGMPVAGPKATNPWARIVACGLGDKGVTSIAAEIAADASPSSEGEAGSGNVQHQQQADVIIGQEADTMAAEIADVWAAEFAARLGLSTAAAATTGDSLEGGMEGLETAASFSSPAVTVEYVIVEED